MYTDNSNVFTGLSSILPTYTEMILNETETPCITYICSNSVARDEGDDIRYSDLYYSIKVWADTVSDIFDYAEQIDNLMFTLGYKRESSAMLNLDNAHLCLVMKYRAFAIERTQ